MSAPIGSSSVVAKLIINMTRKRSVCTTEEDPIEAEESCYQCKELLIQDVLVAVDKALQVEASC